MPHNLLIPTDLAVPGGTPAEKARAALERAFGPGDPVLTALAPGRVNLIGDHTDYNDGFVFPMTIDRGVYVALRRREDRTVRLAAANFGETLTYDLDARPDLPRASWATYVSGVVAELHRLSLIPAGFEAALYGDVPVGSGLSSSAATEIAVVVGLQALFAFPLDPVEAALLAQRVDHNYVGIRSGIMDQFASRLGRVGMALFLDCRSLEVDHIPFLLHDEAVVIIDSKAPRELASSAYNARRAECEEGVRFFQQIDPTIRALRDVPIDMLEAHGDGLSEPVRKRCAHVISENDRVMRARRALEAADPAAFGALMTESHRSLRDLYEVSSPQLDLLVDTALGVDGTLGARLTGAGFGGCTVSLVKKSAVPELRERVGRVYEERFGKTPEVFVLERNVEAGAIQL